MNPRKLLVHFANSIKLLVHFAKKLFVNNRESLIDFRECNPWNLIKLNSMKVNNGNGK